MSDIIQQVFPTEEALEKFFEPLLENERRRREALELKMGLNLLLFRAIATDNRFNRVLTAFDVNVKDARRMMADTVRHFKKQINGGEKNGKN